MTDAQKKEIKRLLLEEVEKHSSQKKAADSLINVSESTIIQIKNDRWAGISDKMWLNIGKQVGFRINRWNFAETTFSKQLTKLLRVVQNNSFTQAIAIPAGRGKTKTLNEYKEHHENVFHVVCAEYMSSKDLLSTILKKMGGQPVGTTANMMEQIVECCLKLETPMIILDEFDKLKDKQKLFFVTLFNMLEDYCALVIMGTMNMKLQLMRKTGKHSLGYEEIFSRIGRRFVTVPDCKLKDVAEICKLNGLDDEQQINSIYNECEGDLRRVKRAVLKARVLEDKNTHLEAA